jgi:adenosine deaminase
MSGSPSAPPELLPGVRVPASFHDLADPDRRAEALREAWRRPKVELHLHLEGTFRPATVCDLAARHDPLSPLARPDWNVGRWTFRDLAGFVQQFRVVNRACLRDLSDLERLAREGFEDLALQHVRYAEVGWSVRLPSHPYYLPLGDAVAAIDRARREVEARTDLQVGLILSLDRCLTGGEPEAVSRAAIGVVEQVLAAREAGARVLGIDLHGDEQTCPDVGPFIDAFRLAAQGGLGLRAHAGEGSGAATVRDSIERLAVQRIGHGVRAAEETGLVRRIAEARVALDICPTSNVRTGTVESLAAHPIRKLAAAGVPITISSDDPIVFETTVTTELALLHLAHELMWFELRDLTLSAVRHSFLSASERAALAASIAAGWA